MLVQNGLYQSLIGVRNEKITSIRDDKSHFYERSIFKFNMLPITFTSRLRFFFLVPHFKLTHFKSPKLKPLIFRRFVSSVVQSFLNH